MWCHVELILSGFRPCFARNATYAWFLIIVLGFIVRCDDQGVSSMMRWLFLQPQFYDPMLRFFRAHSWNLEILMCRWAEMVVAIFPTPAFNGRPLIIGGTIKVPKEGQRMPGVKKLRQESNNNSKPEYIRGHHFGFAGLLAGFPQKYVCVPLHGQLHEGGEAIPSLPENDGPAQTIYTRMAHLLILKASQLGQPCYATADSFYAVGPTFRTLSTAKDSSGQQLVHLITRAKNNTAAYFPDGTGKCRKREKVTITEVFTVPQHFDEADVMVGTETRTLKYCSIDLLWKPVETMLRFVLVIDGDGQYILVSSDLSLPPADIIRIYLYRAKIETTFLFLKHLLGGFHYRFWTKAMPKWSRKASPETYSLPSDTKKLAATVLAIERHVNLAAISLGLLQYLALTRPAQIWRHYTGWLRTRSSEYPSEAVVQSVVRAEFFSSFGKVPFYRTLRLIHERARTPAMAMTASCCL